MNEPSKLLPQRVSVLEQLITISRQLNSTLEMRPLLKQIVEAATVLTDADSASILLLDERIKRLNFAATTGPHAPALEITEVPLENSLAGWVVTNRETAIVNDAQTDPRIFVIDGAGPTLSIVAAPMFFGDRVIGVLESLTQSQRRSFTPQDVETLETLAGIAAVAVQNARLFQQSDWVSEIVHEIRTPLTSIISYADLLRRPNLKETQREQFATIIQQEGERVNALVTQFLELARLESGRVTLEREPLNLPAIAALSADVVRPLAEKQGIELRICLPQEFPLTMGDAQRIHQVLLNLLSNAVKYSGQNTIVELQGAVETEQVIISVNDNGPGIPPEQLPRLFQKFQRLPGSEQRATGAGLGLVIARQIIEAHGGQIWVDSIPGEGTTFHFSLPRFPQN